MKAIEILERHTGENRCLFSILLEHSLAVAGRALRISLARPELRADNDFLLEACLLHDIGCVMVNAPDIACLGQLPYLAHGYAGSDILKAEGYPRHALVCERHTGTGLSLSEIIERNLPLPHREMCPISIEEQIICYADLFYSKTKLGTEQSIDATRAKLARFGIKSVEQFDRWVDLFETKK